MEKTQCLQQYTGETGDIYTKLMWLGCSQYKNIMYINKDIIFDENLYYKLNLKDNKKQTYNLEKKLCLFIVWLGKIC